MRSISVSGFVTASFLAASLFPGPAVGQGTRPADIIPNADFLAFRIKTELKVTQPDYVVFVPEIKNGAVSDTGNEHFLVFDGPDGSLMAVWTQSSAESQPDQHIAFSRSTDEGVMRTATGSPFWSVSADSGETWAQPRRLLRKDGGEPLLHPLSPCPIYDVGGNTAGSGRYALFIHNHDGHYKNYGPADTSYHRRPIYLVSGHHQPGADQPVWFAEPKLFMDHAGVSLGKPGTRGRLDLALYFSFTVRDGRAVLWYPDRKFFLLGRIIEQRRR